ncbi:hypothetical protein HBH50_134820 [Parastagonospora nodorum]|nr:hypothetical protein HBH50_134820 [Parastagonospora nodorum]KAH4085298.1 hypothetical protein HBH48_159140 [Parastagonospora nodorum]
MLPSLFATRLIVAQQRQAIQRALWDHDLETLTFSVGYAGQPLPAAETAWLHLDYFVPAVLGRGCYRFDNINRPPSYFLHPRLRPHWSIRYTGSNCDCCTKMVDAPSHRPTNLAPPSIWCACRSLLQYVLCH